MWSVVCSCILHNSLLSSSAILAHCRTFVNEASPSFNIACCIKVCLQPITSLSRSALSWHLTHHFSSKSHSFLALLRNWAKKSVIDWPYCWTVRKKSRRAARTLRFSSKCCLSAAFTSSYETSVTSLVKKIWRSAHVSGDIVEHRAAFFFWSVVWVKIELCTHKLRRQLNFSRTRTHATHTHTHTRTHKHTYTRGLFLFLINYQFRDGRHISVLFDDQKPHCVYFLFL